MGTIRNRGGYQFQARVRRAGFPPQSKTFETLRDTEKWVRSVEREIGTGAFIPRDTAERTTIQNIANRCREEPLPKQRGKRQEDSRLKVIELKFSAYNLSAVNPAMDAKWRDELSDNLAPQSELRKTPVWSPSLVIQMATVRFLTARMEKIHRNKRPFTLPCYYPTPCCRSC